MKRYLFELTAWLATGGVERRSEWVSDSWLAEQLKQDPNPDRRVEFELGHYPLSDPPAVHRITAGRGPA